MNISSPTPHQPPLTNREVNIEYPHNISSTAASSRHSASNRLVEWAVNSFSDNLIFAVCILGALHKLDQIESAAAERRINAGESSSSSTAPPSTIIIKLICTENVSLLLAQHCSLEVGGKKPVCTALHSEIVFHRQKIWTRNLCRRRSAVCSSISGKKIGSSITFNGKSNNQHNCTHHKRVFTQSVIFDAIKSCRDIQASEESILKYAQRGLQPPPARSRGDHEQSKHQDLPTRTIQN